MREKESKRKIDAKAPFMDDMAYNRSKQPLKLKKKIETVQIWKTNYFEFGTINELGQYIESK